MCIAQFVGGEQCVTVLKVNKDNTNLTSFMEDQSRLIIAWPWSLSEEF